MEDHPNDHAGLQETGQKVALLTCSMARDIDLFALLAESIDEYVSPEIPHRVIVPRADVSAFHKFASDRRIILAQEDVLSFRLWQLPTSLKHLSFLKPGFRRPIYLTSDGKMVRGWMLQQLIKISEAISTNYDAIMHVDSDVCFFKPFCSDDAFLGNRVRYFRAFGKTRNPMHRSWIENACNFLGVDAPEEHDAHYVENCVLWSTDVARAMVKQIEACHGKPFHKVLLSSTTMSEYYLYGLFADLFPEGVALAGEDVSFCNSYWPTDQSADVDFDNLMARLRSKHCAIAIQSTHGIDLNMRAEIYGRARREIAMT